MGTLKRSLRKCVVPPRVFLLRGMATTLFLNPDRLRRGELVPSKHAYMRMPGVANPSMLHLGSGCYTCVACTDNSAASANEPSWSNCFGARPSDTLRQESAA